MLKSVSIIAVLLASVMPAKASGDYTSSAKSILDDDAVEAICLSRYFPIDFSGNCHGIGPSRKFAKHHYDSFANSRSKDLAVWPSRHSLKPNRSRRSRHL